MDWRRHSAGWPHSGRSQFVRSRPHLWHVQQQGTGPDIVLIHGAGGATHSWRGILPVLSPSARVTAMDLPGQGFTKRGAMQRSSLRLMAEDLWALLDHMRIKPDLLVGHSAGGALALQMSLARPTPVFGINTALEDFEGVAGWLFPMMAKFLAVNPLTAPTIAAMLRTGDIRNLIRSTGSTLDAEGMALYTKCLSNAEHLAGTLAMMGQWSLSGLRARLDQIAATVHLCAGATDGTVPPEASARMAEQIPGATHSSLPGLGHLAHEEAPDQVGQMILDFLKTVGPGQLARADQLQGEQPNG